MSGPFGASQWMYATDSGFYDFPISKSLRFEDGDSPTLRRTPGTAGNRKTWTTSLWVKRANLGYQRLGINSGTSNTKFSGFYFNADDTINFFHRNNTSDSYAVTTDRIFRDTSSWYHFVLVADTTQGTAANRIKMFVNGEQVFFPNTVDGTSGFPSQNQDMEVNNTAYHQTIGADWNGADKFDGYHADITHIDGLALTPSSFAETKNDIWIPKDTSGLTFGTNGFRLEFKQTGTGTASSSTIGADTSGEGNHYTSANLVASDVVPDSPTNNFCTPNAIDNLNWISQGLNRVTRSEGSLQMSGDSWITKSTFGMLTGKWYWEVRLEGGAVTAGIHLIDGLQNTHHAYYYYGYTANNVYKYAGNATLFDGSTVSANSILGVAFDADNLTLQYFIGGSSIHTVSDVDAGKYSPSFGTAASSTLQVNFGQDSSFAGNETAQGNADGNGIGDFYYAPPSGFLALCTSNLPDPVEAIDPNKGGSPQDYFNTVLYTGNGSTQSISGVGFQPDFVWVKQRNDTGWHNLADSVRGTGKRLYSNETNAEHNSVNNLSSFDSDGFSVGTENDYSKNNINFASWNWKAGTSFSNDASSTSVGSLDSSGTVNTDVGFSIIKWTAVGSSATQTIAHGLGAVPKMIIMKNRERAVDWAVYHEGLGNTHGMSLNTGSASSSDVGWWNNTTPTSTVFTTGNGNGYRTGGVAEDYIAYCFAEVDGYSKISSYIGNENNDGAFVYTGFRPAFILIKKLAAGDWGIYDSKRLGFNEENAVLYPAEGIAEENQASRRIDLLSNGFKLRTTNVTFNDDSATIYMAFADQPFKYANAR